MVSAEKHRLTLGSSKGHAKHLLMNWEGGETMANKTYNYHNDSEQFQKRICEKLFGNKLVQNVHDNTITMSVAVKPQQLVTTYCDFRIQNHWQSQDYVTQIT